MVLSQGVSGPVLGGWRAVKVKVTDFLSLVLGPSVKALTFPRSVATEAQMCGILLDTFFLVTSTSRLI